MSRVRLLDDELEDPCRECPHCGKWFEWHERICANCRADLTDLYADAKVQDWLDK